MSFDVPDSEKRLAEKASECFDELVSLLRKGSRHLSLIYDPFSKVPQVDQKLIYKYRRVMRRYRNQIKENYTKIMQKARQCTILMAEFSNDTHTVSMMNSFIASIEDLKKAVNRLLPLFSDLSTPAFKDSLISAITNTKQQGNQVKQLINDRILDHIDGNILAKNWTSNVTDEFQNKVYEKLPLIVQLYKDRQKALEEEQ